MARNRKRKKNGVAVRAPNSPPLAVNPPPRPQPVRRVTLTRTEMYAGTVPHPEHARAFEEILPGSFGRFISMAEGQGEHRQQMEAKFLNFNGWAQILGVVFAGLFVLSGIGGGVFLLYHDKKTEGLSAMFGPMATVVAIFLGVRVAQAKEKTRKGNAEGM